jgi:light-regulated signal transduction histidine kinase (bacteriophytochrome)
VRLLRLLMENLLWNSWKFTRHKSQALIEFGTVPENGRSPTYFIRDNGAGFDMEFSEQLFLPFQRLHLETEFEGTGIGLATVQRIVYRHHGRIWAEGYVDEGATFYFTLR